MRCLSSFKTLSNRKPDGRVMEDVNPNWRAHAVLAKHIRAPNPIPKGCVFLLASGSLLMPDVNASELEGGDMLLQQFVSLATLDALHDKVRVRTYKIEQVVDS